PPWWRAGRACAGSGSCAGSPWRHRRRCPARRAPRRSREGSLPASAALVPVPAVAAAPRSVLATALVDIRQQRKLTGPLDRTGDLHLVAPARAGDPPRADLALLGDELPQRDNVLVVDLLDLILAVLAGLAPAAAGSAPLVTPANRLAATPRLGHQDSPWTRVRPGRAVLENTVETSLCG